MKKLVKFFEFTNSLSKPNLKVWNPPYFMRNFLNIAKSKKFSKNKFGIVTEYLPWLLIALAVLAVLVITIFLLKGKGISLIDQIKNLFRGRNG